jgi:hypothetical protein
MFIEHISLLHQEHLNVTALGDFGDTVDYLVVAGGGGWWMELYRWWWRCWWLELMYQDTLPSTDQHSSCSNLISNCWCVVVRWIMNY